MNQWLQMPSQFEISKFRKNSWLRVRYLRNENLKAEKLNQFAINGELKRIFQRTRNQETSLKPVQKFFFSRKAVWTLQVPLHPEDPIHRDPKQDLQDLFQLLLRITKSCNICPLIWSLQERIKLKSKTFFVLMIKQLSRLKPRTI